MYFDTKSDFKVSKRGTNDPKLNCGFERGLCGWVQDVSRDSHDWTLNSGYIRMGAFDETLEHSNAVLLSPEIELMGKFCLEFSFRVYKSVGSLNIKIRVRKSEYSWKNNLVKV